MRRPNIRLLVWTIPFLGAVGCREPGVAPAVQQAEVRFRVTMMSSPSDSRIPTIREAMAHWNSEFVRLGVNVRLDSGTRRDKSVSDDLLRAASDEVLSGSTGPSIEGLRSGLAAVPADIVIALSDTDLISFALAWVAGSQGIVVLRRSDILPLSLPNALRNVVAHELGHVFGLTHNADPTTLMCGRPASCRPDAFASNTPRFFPLTASDEDWLRQRRWP